MDMRMQFASPTQLALLVAVALFALTGCKKDDDNTTDPGPSGYNIPASYTAFENVAYTGQINRMKMLTQLADYMKTANTPGTALSLQTLEDMYRNRNNPFDSVYSQQLFDKTFVLDTTYFLGLLQDLATLSTSTTPGSNGTAGVVTSTTDPSKRYLCDANGVEVMQLVEKGLMGAVFYYQAVETYLREGRIGPNVDNTTVTPGQGTPRQHHWDEAFGYLGVPRDFPTNTTGLLFHGKYCHARNALLSTSTTIMDAFIRGRAAINHNDNAQVEVQAARVRETWERVIAATAISYLNAAKGNQFADDALRNHSLSEAVAFIRSLKYNSTAVITTAQISEVLGYIGTNFYNVTSAGLTQARDRLAEIYAIAPATRDAL
jgi:hypothetical protein